MTMTAAAAEAKIEALRREAVIQAQEMRTQTATVREVARLLGMKTWEDLPGALRRLQARLRDAQTEARSLRRAVDAQGRRLAEINRERDAQERLAEVLGRLHRLRDGVELLTDDLKEYLLEDAVSVDSGIVRGS